MGFDRVVHRSLVVSMKNTYCDDAVCSAVRHQQAVGWLGSVTPDDGGPALVKSPTSPQAPAKALGTWRLAAVAFFWVPRPAARG